MIFFKATYRSSALLFLFFINIEVHAQDLNQQQLKLIQDFAASICNTVGEAKGNKSTAQIEGDVKAQLKGLTKMLADAGVSGKISGKFENFEGLSQEATATALEADRNCRERIFYRLLDRMQETGLPKSTTIKSAIKNGGAIVINVKVPKPGTNSDRSFLRAVGETISIVVDDYDERSGRGKISKLSFGSADGFITATDASLSIANTSSMGCSGNFRLASDGLLRGRVTCKWGDSFPTYDAEIDLGTVR